MLQCPVCRTGMDGGYESWHYICRSCGYEAASLTPVINDTQAHELIDEKSRETGLKALRVHNFRHLLARLRRLRPGGKLLEVGSAYGWFLEEARGSFHAEGLEPDEHVFQIARRKGLPVKCGYFPDAVASAELYDVIVFNDVIEHIPDIVGVLDNCFAHLVPGGLLLLNLPNRDGVFYRLSTFLKRFGVPGPFDRMWQVGLPSPHVHYFNERNIVGLLRERGYLVEEKGRLATIRFSGLFTRISYTGKANVFARALMWAAIVVALPVLRLLPSDIMYTIASKPISKAA